MTEFTNYQNKIYKMLSWLLVCRYYMERDENGRWCIKDTPWWRLIYFYAIWINSTIKVIFLFLTYRGWLIEVHFLDQMSIWDWWFCTAELVQEMNIWIRKYPLYEVLTANWTIMEDVYRKLGSPTHIQDKILKNDKQLYILHAMICFWGCFALMIQFFMNPKYALNTYAIVPYDNFFLCCIFAAHEYLFMLHCWMHLGFTVVLVEIPAVSYTLIIGEMTKVMYQLIDAGEQQPSDDEDDSRDGKKVSTRKDSINSRHKYSNRKGGRTIIERHDTTFEELLQLNSASRRKHLDPATVAPGTEYNIITLLDDYKRITIAMNQFNGWVGKRMAGLDGAIYAQFVSDVFMIFQLLKEPDVDPLGVFFFLEDACAGMILVFWMLILQSRLLPVAEDFIHSLKCYVQYETPLKKFLQKTIPSLRIVSSKVGGLSMKPSTVPKGVNALMNFYISAAMWQRPQDRLT